jgi:hypothetical protein
MHQQLGTPGQTVWLEGCGLTWWLLSCVDCRRGASTGSFKALSPDINSCAGTHMMHAPSGMSSTATMPRQP